MKQILVTNQKIDLLLILSQYEKMIFEKDQSDQIILVL